MSNLSHRGAYRLIHQSHLSTAEQETLNDHLRHCAACRRHAIMAGVMGRHLVLQPVRQKPSARQTAVYLRSAQRRSRRSQIMKPIYALGGIAAVIILSLAGWYLVRPNLETRQRRLGNGR